jgi:hypothetical protein
MDQGTCTLASEAPFVARQDLASYDLLCVLDATTYAFLYSTEQTWCTPSSKGSIRFVSYVLTSSLSRSSLRIL